MISKLINMRYEVLERVGEGTFFQVLKTRDRVTGRVVAVKHVLAAYTPDRAFCEALVKAGGALADLTHPGIARIYETGEEDGAPFLVTEFVRGINLKERIRRIAPFTLSVAVDFAIAVGEALQYAHGRGVIHGDLRPHNVIVSPEGAVKVTDFGLASALAASPAAAMANLDRAAPYRAPELAGGVSPTISTDLYALGVILFEMLTGGLPYSGESPGAIADLQSAEPVPSPRSLNPGVPRSLEGITMKALQRRPEDRYRQAADFLTDLKAVRDALRFGKSLSWSPIEVNAAAAQPPASVPASMAAVGRDRPSKTAAEPTPSIEPRGATRMPSAAVSDDRISPFLKVALATVIIILISSVVVGLAVWMAVMAKPPEQKFPNLVGMNIDAARAVADKANVRLMEHVEFNDKYDPGIIFRADWQPGRPIRPGRSIPVWVSKGSRMVWVPNLLRHSSQDAEDKLKSSGLSLGQVDREFSKDIPFGEVTRQNPRAGKRVNRDLAVNLTVSDGPKPEPEPDTNTDNTNPEGTSPTVGTTGPSPDDTTGGISGGGVGDQDNTASDTPTIQTLKITVKGGGHGERRVMVQYDDTHGTHTPIDEPHKEGDVITRRVEVYGPTMTVRVYYGDDPNPAAEQTVPVGSGNRR